MLGKLTSPSDEDTLTHLNVDDEVTLEEPLNTTASKGKVDVSLFFMMLPCGPHMYPDTELLPSNTFITVWVSNTLLSEV